MWLCEQRGDLRREVGLLREVPETQVGPKIPTNTKRKDFAGNEDHVKVPGDFRYVMHFL